MAKEEKVLWAALFLEVQNSGVLCFPRAEAPLKGEEVHIVAFADGSMTAVCACVYAVWSLPTQAPGAFASTLLMAKCHLSPLGGQGDPQRVGAKAEVEVAGEEHEGGGHGLLALPQ